MKKTLLSILLIAPSLCIAQVNQPEAIMTEENQKETVVTDIDGNSYSVIKIGQQLWLGENIKTTHFSNGDPIPTTTPTTLDVRNENMPAYQWIYENNEEYPEIFGMLYSWAAANDERGICPEGWKIPSEGDWVRLFETLGGQGVAGGKLKEAGTAHWKEPNEGATNESGFTALPSGGRTPDGSFYGKGIHAAWWTSSPGLFVNIEYDDPYTYRPYYYRSVYYGFPVRCIKK
jgi:uncharacterized protein (TIGR02145 family)